MANILVIDDDKNILRLLDFTIKRAGHTITSSEDGLQGLAQAEAQRPDLIVADVMMPNMTGYDFCRQARTKPVLKETPIIIFSARFQPIDKQTALEAGATDYLPKTTSPDALIKRINELIAATSKPVAAQGKVGIFSLRGGAGTTSLAVNFAALLAQLSQARTLLVDLARLGGHAALMLGLRPAGNIAQLLESAPDDLTTQTIKPYLTPHDSGLYLLASSHVYGHELSLADARLPQLLSLMKSAFPYVVLDIPHSIEPQFTPVLRDFDKIAVVLSPDMPSLQSTAIALQSLARLGVPEEKISLVVNQVIPQGALPAEVIQKVIKRPVVTHIPFDPEMIKAVNSGKPLVLTNPQSPAATAVAGLANKLLG
jgi:pilus assembly protein CpaE